MVVCAGRLGLDPTSDSKAARVDEIDRVAVDVGVGLLGLIDGRIDAHELSRRRVVVAVNSAARRIAQQHHAARPFTRGSAQRSERSSVRALLAWPPPRRAIGTEIHPSCADGTTVSCIRHRRAATTFDELWRNPILRSPAANTDASTLAPQNGVAS